MKKKICVTVLTAVVASAVLSACHHAAVSSSQNINSESFTGKVKAGRLSIVCTNFPEYDFARQITGEQADVTMLLKPGAESHSYEPTPEDIITIQNSNLFVYVGGDSDEWVSDVLRSMDTSDLSFFKLMDQVKTVEEETVEGMEPEEEETTGDETDQEEEEKTGRETDQEEEKTGSETGQEEEETTRDETEPEMDEHVWTAPANAITIVEKMEKEIAKLDPSNKDVYSRNAEAYIRQLQTLDGQFKNVVDHAKRKEIIVADRFPFRYFCEEYGLTYYAAFPGCSTDTQPSAKTVAFLTDKVKQDGIPTVFHIELSNEEMADSIAESTGAKSELLNAVHNVTDEDFKNGATYISLMQHNVEVLQEALN